MLRECVDSLGFSGPSGALKKASVASGVEPLNLVYEDSEVTSGGIESNGPSGSAELVSPWGTALAISALGGIEAPPPQETAASATMEMVSPWVASLAASALGITEARSGVPMVSDLLLPFHPGFYATTAQQQSGYSRASLPPDGPSIAPVPPRTRHDPLLSSPSAATSRPPEGSTIDTCPTITGVVASASSVVPSPFADQLVQAYAPPAGPSNPGPGTLESPLSTAASRMTGRVATMEPNPDVLFELDWER